MATLGARQASDEAQTARRLADCGRGSRRGHRVGGPHPPPRGPARLAAACPSLFQGPAAFAGPSQPRRHRMRRRRRRARRHYVRPPPRFPPSGLCHSRPFSAPLPVLCDPLPPPFRDHHPLPRRAPTSHPGAVYTLSAASRAVHVPPSYGCCGGPVDALAAAGPAPLAGGLPVNGDRRGLVCDGGQDRMRLR